MVYCTTTCRGPPLCGPVVQARPTVDHPAGGDAQSAVTPDADGGPPRAPGPVYGVTDQRRRCATAPVCRARIAQVDLKADITTEHGLAGSHCSQPERCLVIVPWRDGEVVHHIQRCDSLKHGLRSIGFRLQPVAWQAEGDTSHVVQPRRHGDHFTYVERCCCGGQRHQGSVSRALRPVYHGQENVVCCPADRWRVRYSLSFCRRQGRPCARQQHRA
jgi:hypothetical protein